MRRPLVALASLASLAGCDAALDFGATVINLGALVLVMAALVEGARRIADPARHDPATRALLLAARSLHLSPPRRARRLEWRLPSGLEAHAEIGEPLEFSVALADHLPRTLVVDRPRLPPGIGPSQLPLPEGLLGDFFVLGAEADALGVLSHEVRRALLACGDGPMHVAMEQGHLLIRLPLDAADLADEAALRLDQVARVIVRQSEDPATRLAALVKNEAEPRALRIRALGALLEAFPEAEVTRVATEVAGDLDEARLRRWAGRHGAGALSLDEGPDPTGAVALVEPSGGLSEPD